METGRREEGFSPLSSHTAQAFHLLHDDFDKKSPAQSQDSLYSRDMKSILPLHTSPKWCVCVWVCVFVLHIMYMYISVCIDVHRQAHTRSLHC